jgi:hypothetical protein
MSPTALLHAALQNLLARTNRASQRSAFFDCVGDRLFQINVFARREGIDCHSNVPVIRRRDDHRVNVLREDLSIIQVSRRKSTRTVSRRHRGSGRTRR